MTPQRVALADTPPVPWRNGGGLTRELLAWPHVAEWRVRVSVAEIEADGPFSSFSGIERWFAVIEGGGVALTIDGVEHRVRPGDAPVSFPGDAAVGCRLLDGKSRDLNLMLRGTGGAMVAVVAGQAWIPPGPHCGLYARVAGRCDDDTTATELPADSLAWFAKAPEALTFHSEDPSDGTPPGWWLAVAREAGP